MKALPLVLGLSFSLFACRDDFDVPDYSTFEDAFERAEAERAGEVSALAGADPFNPDSDNRLALAVFYDGEDATQFLRPGANDIAFFIFEDTFTLGTSTNRVQGESSTEFTLAGATGFWGGGTFATGALFDLTEYQTLSIALNGGEFSSFDSINLIVEDSNLQAVLPAADYGYVNDGEWHQLFVPLEDFANAGVDLSRAFGVLSLSNERTVTGHRLLVDNGYFDEDSVDQIMTDLGVASR
ncbi:MAG: hypothetical protein AAFX94_06925 [Myxococcota bacterium]